MGQLKHTFTTATTNTQQHTTTGQLTTCNHNTQHTTSTEQHSNSQHDRRRATGNTQLTTLQRLGDEHTTATTTGGSTQQACYTVHGSTARHVDVEGKGQGQVARSTQRQGALHAAGGQLRLKTQHNFVVQGPDTTYTTTTTNEGRDNVGLENQQHTTGTIQQQLGATRSTTEQHCKFKGNNDNQEQQHTQTTATTEDKAEAIRLWTSPTCSVSSTAVHAD